MLQLFASSGMQIRVNANNDAQRRGLSDSPRELKPDNMGINVINSSFCAGRNTVAVESRSQGDSFSKYSSSSAKNLGIHFIVFVTTPDAIRALNGVGRKEKMCIPAVGQ